ncbi:glycogen/starch/alpha-glucan phosphorylase [Parachlamydia sp. AcF125]|uniref:glycogen/starch/alpha-glucan phosphorylase n=1 Tax=Parachlamydia sp. AcF125 TaxID=2795736 RepID=UPI001BC94D6D|nr:glycogen/starch/alpha-glucan phosphorylase [Parachlamydia sp. AcF125]MBS4167413.1 Glycogen phosphorylase [Parachlamydia sp. AcF125]
MTQPAPDLDYQAEMLAAKTKHYLITTMGRTSTEANHDEFYRAFSYALREEIMINWLATAKTQDQRDVRKLYYLSLEYLPGRILSNGICNLSAQSIVERVLRKMNRSYKDIIGRESDPALGNGGLGRLASCFLDSLATQHLPAQAYGLRYQYGIFEQQLWDGVQVEVPDCWLLNENPWEFRRDLRRVVVKYCGDATSTKNIHGDEVQNLANYEEVFALPYDVPIIGYSKTPDFSVVTLRLWSTKESPRNFQLQRYNAGSLGQAAENTTLTDVLYPNDNHETGKRIRLKQEFLLVSASLQDIIRHYLSSHDSFRSFPDKVRIQINDTHPSLVIAELVRLLTFKHDIPWKLAVEMTQACTGYTNHTILSEALEEWDQSLFQYLLPRQYKIVERLNYDFCNALRAKFPNDEPKVQRVSILENGKVRMANLAIMGSHSVNGVAALHTEILKKSVFKDFYDFFPEKFVNVTNGVTQRRWLLECNPELAHFITKRIGDGWITDFTQISKLAQFASEVDSQEEFLAIKTKNKQKLIDYIKQENPLHTADGEAILMSPVIDPYSLFDIQIKRIHEYKRQLMNALHLIMLYHEILENPQHNRVPRTVIFAGKAAAGYEAAKDIIRLIFCIARRVNKDPAIHNLLKVIYVENYNVSKAEFLIPAADISEQISTAGTEASGTGNMKLAMNGALTVGTEDGANIEMRQEIGDQWWPFSFGCSAEEIQKMRQENSYRSADIYASNPQIRRAVDALRDRSFAQNDSEHQAFTDLYRKLMEMHYGGAPDRYFILKDLESFYLVQKKAESLFLEPLRWAEYALHNIAGMGKFSVDYSIKNYSEKIWGLSPCLLDPEILDHVRDEFTQQDQCRVF